MFEALAPTPSDEPTQSDNVYVSLRRAIVKGDLRPNQRIVEAELAAALNVSRTPVREALLRLETDHLVFPHRRGWIVREHTPIEIREIYETRAALEGFGARIAAIRATPDQVAAIQQALDATHGLVGPSRKAIVDLNDRFHDAVIAAAGNAMLAQLIERSRLYHFNYRLAAAYTDHELGHSHEQHLGLARAILDRNPDVAERFAREHVQVALEMILSKVF